jgi:hypothetical protein
MVLAVAIALNPAGGLENIYGTDTVTVAGSEWTALPAPFLAFTTML